MSFPVFLVIAVAMAAIILNAQRWPPQAFARGDWPDAWPQLAPWPIGKLLGVLAIVLLFLIAMEAQGPAFTLLALLTAAIFFFWAWQREFVYLMGLRDDAFPGRHDKLIWAFFLLMLAPIGLWFFRSYRLAHWPEPKAKPKPARQGGHTVSDLF
jgi:hypothetical protein